MYKYCLTFLLAGITIHAVAQNPLPDFSVDSLGKNRTRISWVNPFGSGVVQISIQASADSVKNFRTFFSSPSPQLPQNGIVDNKVYGTRVWYRIFYAFSGGSYQFTKAKSGDRSVAVLSDQPKANIAAAEPPPVMMSNTPSTRVVVNHDGFAEIHLPDAAMKKYKLVFFDENHNEIFTINKITEPELVLDKTNFLHAGYFYFDLYDGTKLIEKNKIYLQKEF